MIELYSKRFSGVHLSHLVNAFTQCYEQFKDSSRYPSPDEILLLANQERRAIGQQESGPLKVYEGNREMLQLFIKAFRESGLKGEELEKHLNQVVEENHQRLCGTREPKCKVCKDQGFYRVWFLYFPGRKWEKPENTASGKTLSYWQLQRVPNGPVWVQDSKPDIEPVEGQELTDGIVACECEKGREFSFPRLELEP